MVSSVHTMAEEVHDEQWQTLRGILTALSGADVKKLHGKLLLEKNPTGKNAKLRTIEKIVTVPTTGLVRAQSAYKRNGARYNITGTDMQVAKELVRRGLLDEYYKIRPQSDSSWYRSILEIMRIHDIGIVEDNRLIPTADDATSGADVIQKTVDTSNQTEQSDDVQWHNLLANAESALTMTEALLEVAKMDFKTLIKCRTKINLVVEDLHMYLDHRTCDFETHYNQCYEMVERVKALFETKVEEATLEFESALRDVSTFLVLKPIPQELRQSAPMIVELYADFEILTGIFHHLELINQLTEFRSTNVVEILRKTNLPQKTKMYRGKKRKETTKIVNVSVFHQK